MEGQPGSTSMATPNFNRQYDHSKTSISRRSVDWRDSGIVIDDDQQQFSNSIERICSLSSTTSNGRSISSSSSSSYHPLFEHDYDGDTILHLAVVGCTVDKVRDLIRICDLNAINNMMQTPLHVATMADRPEMVGLLLSSGARLNMHDRRGNTPLHLACQKGYIDVANIILDCSLCNTFPNNELTLKQYIELTNFDGQTCLHLAASHDQRGIVELLVNRYNSDLSCRDTRSGETIVHKAISLFNIDLLAFILNLGKHCNVADYCGRRPLDTIKILKESKIDKQQYDKLLLAEELIKNEIELCIEQNGCCAPTSNQQTSFQNGILDQSSSSSSDYSDSDSNMG